MAPSVCSFPGSVFRPRQLHSNHFSLCWIAGWSRGRVGVGHGRSGYWKDVGWGHGAVWVRAGEGWCTGRVRGQYWENLGILGEEEGLADARTQDRSRELSRHQRQRGWRGRCVPESPLPRWLAGPVQLSPKPPPLCVWDPRTCGPHHPPPKGCHLECIYRHMDCF